MRAVPLAVAGGPQIAGAFMRNVAVRLDSPASGATNTSATATLSGTALDPFRRLVAVAFELDRAAAFASPDLQQSSNVNGVGWADTPISWASAAIGNGSWYFRARSTLLRVGSGPGTTGRWSTARGFVQAGGAGIPRSLYLYENKGVEVLSIVARDLYLYVNKGVEVLSVIARCLYLYENRAIYVVVTARALYLYRATRDSEVFPYLNHIDPVEQYEGGQVSLYGDGFGQYLEARSSATLSVSSTNGGNLPENVRDGIEAEWQSTSGASAWIRFTWGAAKKIVAIALECSRNGTSWGIPRFRFDDASSQDGSVAPSVPVAILDAVTTEYKTGAWRTLYTLATPKTTTYVEIAIASGGSGTNRGFAEVWILEEIEPAQNAETARAVLNLGLPSETPMGIVAWAGRSPNWWPANSGLPVGPAALVTVPTGAVSGLVHVEETT